MLGKKTFELQCARSITNLTPFFSTYHSLPITNQQHVAGVIMKISSFVGPLHYMARTTSSSLPRTSSTTQGTNHNVRTDGRRYVETTVVINCCVI